MNPDGISYVEIAWAGAQSGWKSFVNGYWSPLYPFLLSIAFRLFRPGPYWESTVVHGVNLAVYLATLAGFEFFLRELIIGRGTPALPQGALRPVPGRTLRLWGYVFLLWACQFWLSPAMVTPDLGVAGLVFVATALLVRIHAGRGSWGTFALLGAVLGVSYLAKASMFPLAFVFLACGFLALSNARRALPRALLAFLVFLVCAAPELAALSEAKGRLTFGDSGRINYAEYVGGAAKWTHWQGGPPGTGVPAHPTRQWMLHPPLYEFAGPVAGSYPPWFDPSYWYEGVVPHFSLMGQLGALLRSANAYLRVFSAAGTLWVVFAALFVLVRRSGSWTSGIKGQWPIWLPAYVALGMFALVHVETRFVGGFALILLMKVLAGVRFSPWPWKAWRSRVALVVVIAPVAAIAWSARRDFAGLFARKPFEQWEVAHRLHAMGIQPGCQGGSIGSGSDAYWAHLAGVRIVAEIPDQGQDAFWQASEQTKAEVMVKFAAAGARVVVTRTLPSGSAPLAWRQVPQTRYYAYELPAEASDKTLCGGADARH
jgi:hypothetical protein